VYIDLDDRVSETSDRWVLSAVQAGVDDARWAVDEVPATSASSPTCVITSDPQRAQEVEDELSAGRVILLAFCGMDGVSFSSSNGLTRTRPSRPTKTDFAHVREGTRSWLEDLQSEPRQDPPDLRKEIERFCGWVEVNLTANGRLEQLLDAVQEGPARTDRRLKQELVRTRASLDQAGRLVEALRAELLKDRPTTESTKIVAQALGASSGIAAGFAMGVLATMVATGTSEVGGALVVGAGGSAMWEALKGVLTAVRLQATARADAVIASAADDSSSD